VKHNRPDTAPIAATTARRRPRPVQIRKIGTQVRLSHEHVGVRSYPAIRRTEPPRSHNKL